MNPMTVMIHLLHRFRTLIVLFIGLLAASGYSPRTFGALIAYEGFDYPAGSDINDANGGIGWATPWAHTDNSGAAVAAGIQSALAGSLTYTDAAGRKLVTSGNKAVFNGSNAVNSQIGRNMSTRRSDDGTTT